MCHVLLSGTFDFKKLKFSAARINSMVKKSKYLTKFTLEQKSEQILLTDNDMWHDKND